MGEMCAKASIFTSAPDPNSGRTGWGQTPFGACGRGLRGGLCGPKRGLTPLRAVRGRGPVRDLVAGSGIEFRERPPAPLMGVPGEWRLHTVLPHGLGLA